jgi:HK97 family phage prohead protease
MRIEIRADSVLVEGYVNAVGRDSRPLLSSDGSRFVEQIVPGAFARALSKRDVDILLNHDETKKLGSTQSNLTLIEDSIGLKARAIIKDSTVIEKARAKKLTGWSFGFYDINTRTEDIKEGLKRRFVEDLELVEVSIIDDTLVPAYQGTSIETRADNKSLIKANVLLTRADYCESDTPPDYSNYKERIAKLERV